MELEVRMIPISQIKWRKLTPKLRKTLKTGDKFLWFRKGHDTGFTTFWRWSNYGQGNFKDERFQDIIDPTHVARINKPRGVK